MRERRLDRDLQKGHCDKQHSGVFRRALHVISISFVDAVNEALAALMQRRQYKNRIRENKGLSRPVRFDIGNPAHVASDVETGPEFYPKDA